jgi:intein-encoded DNA endonuclease-like protein
MQEHKLRIIVEQPGISEGSVKGNYKLAMEYYEQSYKLRRNLVTDIRCNALANLGFTAGMRGISLAYCITNNPVGGS